MTVLAEEAIHRAALYERGVKAFRAYYGDGQYANAKLAAGMAFTPELVGYLEREVANRKVAEEIRKKNLESENAESIPTEHVGESKSGGDGGGDSADSGSSIP